MRLYPAYKLRDVLDEYAVVFYSLLNEGYRQRSADYMAALAVSDFPQQDREHRMKLIKNLEWAAVHPADILNPGGKGSSDADIKKLLQGK